MGAPALGIAAWSSAAPASATWPAANRIIFVPFELSHEVVVTKLCVYNGATAGANTFDVGIYTKDVVRIVAAGSTSGGSTSALQEIDITDTILAPGQYYMGMVCSNTTRTAFRVTTPPVNALKLMGIAQVADGVPMGAGPLTLAVPASAYIPLMGFVCYPRTLLA